jgi:hypothetical protein
MEFLPPPNNNLICEYEEKLEKYRKTVNNLKYFFDVEKCCGYSEFVTVYKTNTLANIYIETRNQFLNPTIIDLFATNTETNERLILPNDDTINIREFILNNADFFKPVYPLPAYVVYKIKFDDGHVH